MNAGVFFSNGPPGHYWYKMVQDVCAALARANCPCDPLAPTILEDVVPILRQADTKKPCFAASFNFRIFGIDESLQRQVFPDEFMEAPPIISLLDHPAHEFDSLMQFEKFSHARPNVVAPRYGVMDPDHVAFMIDQGIATDRVFLFPQGGPPVTSVPPPMTERPIDFIFHGSIAELESDDAFFSRLGITNPTARTLFEGAMEQVLNGSQDPYNAAQTALNNLGHKAPAAAAAMAKDVDRRARVLRRWTMLTNLKDLPIHFCGSVCTSFKRQNPNGIYLGPLPFTEVTEQIRSSKIMLNDTINLRHTALMRLHYAMADGCVVASEQNLGLSQQFEDGRNILFLTGTTEDAQKLQALAADSPTLQSIAEAATATHSTAHLWDHRIGGLLSAIAT